MDWYVAEDRAKSVREVVVEVPKPQPVDSKFGMLLLGSSSRILLTNVWVTGFFRLDGDPGPYLMLRADGHAGRLKSQSFRVAFCFYRMKAGGLVALFIDFPTLKIGGAPSAPFVLFEMIRGVDMEDERKRISDAINREQLHICFAEGDGPGENLPGGGYAGGAINASYDVLIDIDAQCREALNREWESLLDYHRALLSGRRDFQASIAQMQSENPLTHNPIVSRGGTTNTEAPASSDTQADQATPFMVFVAETGIEKQRVMEAVSEWKGLHDSSFTANIELSIGRNPSGDVVMISTRISGSASRSSMQWDLEAAFERQGIVLASTVATRVATAGTVSDQPRKKWWKFWE